MMLFCFIKCITTTGNACSAPMCLRCVNIFVLIKVMKRENKRTSVGHRSDSSKAFCIQQMPKAQTTAVLKGLGPPEYAVGPYICVDLEVLVTFWSSSVPR